MRFATLTFGALAIAGCGGDVFETADLTVDAAIDTSNPARDGSSDGTKGGNGGAGGMAGAGGTAGVGGGGGGAAGGADAAKDQSGGDDQWDTPPPWDTPGDEAWTDGRMDDAAIDVPRSDADSGQADVSSDIPTGIDVTISSDARDGGDGSATSDARDTVADMVCTEPVVFYKDEDGDGFGKNTDTMMSCIAPGGKWSSMGGDCRDDLPAVKPFRVGMPNPPAYSGTGYPETIKPQGVSFDYDCSGAEEADPTNAYGADPDCSGLLNCNGAGYVAANPSRQGPGINPRCGSLTVKRCMGPLPCTSVLEDTTIPYRCR